MSRRKRNIAGFYGADGLFHPIRSPQFVGQQKRPAKLRDRKKYSRAKAGDLGKRKQILAREDVFDKAIRRERELDAKDARQKARILAEIDRDVYGNDDRRNKGKGRTLMQFVRGMGGISATARHGGRKAHGRKSFWDKGEVNRLSYKETGARGLVKESGGRSMDKMFQAARESGYNVESIDDMMSRIEDEATGGSPTYATHGALSYNPAALGKTDLYVAQLGARSFGVFLKTYLLKKFATKLAAQNYMKSIRSRTKGNPKTPKRAGARAANPIKIKLYKFHAGQKLATRSIGDHDIIFRATVVSRTPKFLMLKIEGERELKRVGVSKYQDTETCYPFGRYSMAPSFWAKDGDRVGNPKSKKNPFPAMHPIAAAAAGLSAISTALHIHEQVKKSSMKKAPRRKASNGRKTNGTTSAKRQNPAIKKNAAFYVGKEGSFWYIFGREGQKYGRNKQGRPLKWKTSSGAVATLKKWKTESPEIDWLVLTAKQNPTPATLARCRKLLAEDRRSTRKQIAEIPISHYRKTANPKKVNKLFGKTFNEIAAVAKSLGKTEFGVPKFMLGDAHVYISRNGGSITKRGDRLFLKFAATNPNASASAKSPVKPAKRNGRRLRKVVGMKGRSRRVLPRITRRKVKRNIANVPRRRTFEMFQGRPATKAVPVPVSHFYAGKRFDMLGDLIELKLHSGRVLKFNPTKTKLCAIGGKLILAGQGARIAKPNPAGLANGIDAIDAIDHVVYRTYKPHHGDSPNQQYIHKLGEETGHMPLLCADKQGYAVIRGGRYKIEARGIVN